MENVNSMNYFVLHLISSSTSLLLDRMVHIHLTATPFNFQHNIFILLFVFVWQRQRQRVYCEYVHTMRVRYVYKPYILLLCNIDRIDISRHFDPY